MKNLYGWGAYFTGLCGFLADVGLVVIAFAHPAYGMIRDVALVGFFAITAMAVSLCCILVYLARHED